MKFLQISANQFFHTVKLFQKSIEYTNIFVAIKKTLYVLSDHIHLYYTNTVQISKYFNESKLL